MRRLASPYKRVRPRKRTLFGCWLIGATKFLSQNEDSFFLRLYNSNGTILRLLTKQGKIRLLLNFDRKNGTTYFSRPKTRTDATIRQGAIIRLLPVLSKISLRPPACGENLFRTTIRLRVEGVCRALPRSQPRFPHHTKCGMSNGCAM